MSPEPRIPEVELAREPAFRLRDVEVRPATREVLAPARREVLEPRVMQVLAALARRRGEVVSRDELITACWGGRVVSEDAIQRCIARLRQLAGAVGGFEIETVARVGYRLTEIQAEAMAPRQRRRWPLVLAAATVVFAAATAWFGWRAWQSREPPTPQVVVQPFRLLGGDARAAAFAASVSDDLVGVLNGAAIRTSTRTAGAPGDLSLSGTVYEEGGVMRVRVQLDDVAGKLTIWSSQFERPVSEGVALRGAVAGASAMAIYAAFEPLQERGGRTLDPAALAAYVRGDMAIGNPQFGSLADPLAALRQAAALAPGSAVIHAHLAFALQSQSGWAARAGAKAEAAQLRRQAQDEAARAIRIDPAQAGAAYGSLYLEQTLDDRRELVRREDLLLQNLDRTPRFPYLYMFECRFLQEVGRVQASRPYCAVAVGMQPLSTALIYSNARALFLSDNLNEARRQIARARLYQPDGFQVRKVQFDFEAFTGSVDAALQMVHAPDVPPSEYVAAGELMLRARKSRAPGDAAAAMQALWKAARDGQLDPRYVVLGAATLGRVDDAFAAIDEFLPLINADEGLLFEPVSAPLRRDARFWPVAARLGLIRYWQARQAWPDFCSDRAEGVDCQKMAASVSGSAGRASEPRWGEAPHGG